MKIMADQLSPKTHIRVSRDSPIVKIIEEKAANDTQSDTKILLLVCGGGMSSIYSAGILAGLESLNLADAFDVIVGVSAGSINSAFFCAKQAQSLLNLYINNFVNCVNPYQPWKFFDIQTVEKSIRDRLNQNKVTSSKTQIFSLTTNITNGQSQLFNIKNDDMIKYIMASATPAVGWSSSVQIGGENFLDGEISSPLPIKEVYESCLPTHILIILNRPLGQTHPSLPIWLKNIGEIFLSIYNPKLRSCYINWESNYAYSLICVESLAQKIPIGIISPAVAVSELCRDINILNQTFNLALSSVLDIFKKPL